MLSRRKGNIGMYSQIKYILLYLSSPRNNVEFVIIIWDLINRERVEENNEICGNIPSMYFNYWLLDYCWNWWGWVQWYYQEVKPDSKRWKHNI